MEYSLRSTLERKATELAVLQYQDKNKEPCAGMSDVMDTEFYDKNTNDKHNHNHLSLIIT